MFTFQLPINSKNIWTLCFRDKKEMSQIYWSNSNEKDDGSRIFGMTEYATSTVYIDKELDGYLLGKVLRHELTHIYLWETGQQDRILNEEETADFMSVAGPIVVKACDNIITRLMEGGYKHG